MLRPRTTRPRQKADQPVDDAEKPEDADDPQAPAVEPQQPEPYPDPVDEKLKRCGLAAPPQYMGSGAAGQGRIGFRLSPTPPTA